MSCENPLKPMNYGKFQAVFALFLDEKKNIFEGTKSKKGK